MCQQGTRYGRQRSWGDDRAVGMRVGIARMIMPMCLNMGETVGRGRLAAGEGLVGGCCGRARRGHAPLRPEPARSPWRGRMVTRSVPWQHGVEMHRAGEAPAGWRRCLETCNIGRHAMAGRGNFRECFCLCGRHPAGHTLLFPAPSSCGQVVRKHAGSENDSKLLVSATGVHPRETPSHGPREPEAVEWRCAKPLQGHLRDICRGTS